MGASTEDDHRSGNGRSPQPAMGRSWLAAYDDEVPAEVDVGQRTLAGLLDEAAERWPGSPAISYLGRDTSYRELRRDVDLFSTALSRLSVRPGDRVALVLPNCPQLIIGLHAVLRLGAVAVPLNPSWSEQQLRAALCDCAAEVVLCLDRVYERVGAVREAGGTNVREVVVTAAADYLPALDRLALSMPSRPARLERARAAGAVPPGAGVRMWNEEMRRARGVPVPASDGAPSTDPAVLIYPPSRTSQPEQPGAAVLTSTNLLAAGAQCAAWLTHARPGRELVLLGLPLFTAEALTLSLGAATLLGAGLLLLPRAMGEASPGSLDACRPTIVAATSAFLWHLVAEEHDLGIDLRSVRVCVTGPDPLPPDEIARLEQLTGGARVVDGLSVCGASVVLGPPLRAARLDEPGARRQYVPLPSTDIRVLDRNDEPLPAGRPGRLAVKGPQVFAGYWQHPGETRSVLQDGWLRTDVWVCLHPDGSVEVLYRDGAPARRPPEVVDSAPRRGDDGSNPPANWRT